MNERDAKKLKPGDRVQYMDYLPNDDNGSLGTVTACDYSQVIVQWDDGLECEYPHILAGMIHAA